MEVKQVGTVEAYEYLEDRASGDRAIVCKKCDTIFVFDKSDAADVKDNGIRNHDNPKAHCPECGAEAKDNIWWFEKNDEKYCLVRELSVGEFINYIKSLVHHPDCTEVDRCPRRHDNCREQLDDSTAMLWGISKSIAGRPEELEMWKKLVSTMVWTVKANHPNGRLANHPALELFLWPD